ncbi:hypothetical protein HDU93_002798 [Gonapodya sp. JEL0774]|nr:hypothetical protein HDU93_002798 [Gonapodya sp. JEL0774]
MPVPDKKSSKGAARKKPAAPSAPTGLPSGLPPDILAQLQGIPGMGGFGAGADPNRAKPKTLWEAGTILRKKSLDKTGIVLYHDTEGVANRYFLLTEDGYTFTVDGEHSDRAEVLEVDKKEMEELKKEAEAEGNDGGDKEPIAESIDDQSDSKPQDPNRTIPLNTFVRLHMARDIYYNMAGGEVDWTRHIFDPEEDKFPDGSEDFHYLIEAREGVEAKNPGQVARALHFAPPKIQPIPPLLHIATYNLDFQTVRVLLKHGADPNIRDQTESTPLGLLAALCRHAVALGASDELRCNHGIAGVARSEEEAEASPVEDLGEEATEESSAIAKDTSESDEKAAETKAKPRRRPKPLTWDDPSHESLYRHNVINLLMVSDALLEGGAKIDEYSRTGARGSPVLPPLLAALFKENDSLVAEWVRRGARMENFPGMTKESGSVLHWAVVRGMEETVEAVLERYRKADERKASGTTEPSPKQDTTAESHKKSAVDPAALDDLRSLQEAVNRPFFPATESEPNRSTPLHFAAQAGHAYIAKLLIESGADPVKDNGSGQNALHVAASWGRPTVVKYLCELYFPIADTKADSGEASATSRSEEESTASAPFGIDALDAAGNTALDLALTRGFVQTAAILKRHNATSKSKDVLRSCCNVAARVSNGDLSLGKAGGCEKRESRPVEFPRCSKCKTVVYCGKECQVAVSGWPDQPLVVGGFEIDVASNSPTLGSKDWPTHKKFCSAVVARNGQTGMPNE